MTASRTARLVVAIAASVVVALAGACGRGGADRPAVRRLSIATGGTGGVYYPYGGGLAQILTKHLLNVEATAEVTGASVDNLKFLRQGTSDIGFVMADAAEDAVAGRGAFAEFGAVQARALAVLYPNHMHLVTLAGRGISRVADLRGRVVSLGSPGGGGAVQAERILLAAGIDPARDIRPQQLGVAQAVDALKDGKLDAFFWSGGLPTAAIQELVNTRGVAARLLPLDDVLPPLQKTHGTDLYYRSVIPRGIYGAADETPVIAVANMLVVSAEMPDPLAYDITRVLFAEQAALAAIHPQARELAVDRALRGATIPFHPGSIRFYRERGVWPE